ncbi:hypothetical protein BH11PLA2_BH11PLA2_29800 [soil metagenome]
MKYARPPFPISLFAKFNALAIKLGYADEFPGTHELIEKF